MHEQHVSTLCTYKVIKSYVYMDRYTKISILSINKCKVHADML